MPQQMMKLARSLDSTEVLVFAAIISREPDEPTEDKFIPELARTTGLLYSELIVESLAALGKKRLIVNDQTVKFDHSNSMGQTVGRVSLPTSLGNALGDFIKHS